MILEQCTKDFRALINQWNVIKKFEHLEESGQRCVFHFNSCCDWLVV